MNMIQLDINQGIIQIWIELKINWNELRIDTNEAIQEVNSNYSFSQTEVLPSRATNFNSLSVHENMNKSWNHKNENAEG